MYNLIFFKVVGKVENWIIVKMRRYPSGNE